MRAWNNLKEQFACLQALRTVLQLLQTQNIWSLLMNEDYMYLNFKSVFEAFKHSAERQDIPCPDGEYCIL